MNQKTKRHLIVDYLKKNYGAKAIILCGSRVVGDYEDSSDWDMFVFTDKAKNGEFKKFPNLPGEELDVVILPTKQKWDWDVFKWKLRFSEILLDTPNSLAKNIRRDAFKIYNKGPKKWSAWKYQARIAKSIRYNKRVKELLKLKKHDLLYLRIGYYFEWVLEWWFELKQEWPMRAQQAFPYIKKHDPKFYAQLKRIFDDTSLKTKVNSCNKIHKLLFVRK